MILRVTGASALSAGPDGAWYAIDFDAQDYCVTAQFDRSDGIKGNVMGHVDMFGPIGESGGGTGVCSANAIDSSASCARKLVFSDKTSVLFRVRPDKDVAYKLVFKIDPLPGD